MTTGRRRMFEFDYRTNLRAMAPDARGRVNFLLDGGIRDLFNFGLGAKQVFGLVKQLRPDDSALYRDFVEIPGMADPRTGAFAPWGHHWDKASKDLLVLYGKENPTDQDRVDGEGDHTGTLNQAVNRMAVLYNWTAAQWPSLPRPSTPLGGTSYEERDVHSWYDSKLLGGKREFALFLPPGYDAPENADVRYPVMYMLHGYTGEPSQMSATGFLADAYMKDTDVRLRPMIVVFPDGACCFVSRSTGARDCRETDDAGKRLEANPDWERECVGGTFFVDRNGYRAGDERKYGEAIYELMDEIDRRYRTLPPADLDAR
jgi:hypothetical protein